MGEYLRNQYEKRKNETYAIKQALLCILNAIDRNVNLDYENYQKTKESYAKYIKSTIKLLEETDE